MCLGIPGRVVEIYEENGLKMGVIDFGGVLKRACLEYLPEVAVGDYAVVHVGFAISRLDEGEAQRVFRWLAELGEWSELKAEGAEAPDRPSVQ